MNFDSHTLHPKTLLNIKTYSDPVAVESYCKEKVLYPIEYDIVKNFFPPPPAHILDIGCGAGRTTGHLMSMGYKAVGIDLSEDLLVRARKQLPEAKFFKMDACQLSFDKASFEAAFFSFNGIDCIYPEASRFQAFRETYRVLKSKGVFCFSSHNVWGRFGRNFNPKAWKSLLPFILKQIKNKNFFEGYWVYPESNGSQLLYSKLPWINISFLESLGYKVQAVLGGKKRFDPEYKFWIPDKQEIKLDKSKGVKTSLLNIALTCHHIHYVALKL